MGLALRREMGATVALESAFGGYVGLKQALCPLVTRSVDFPGMAVLTQGTPLPSSAYTSTAGRHSSVQEPAQLWKRE